MRTSLGLALLVACGGSGGPPAAKPHHVRQRGSCPPERDDGSYDLDAAKAHARRGEIDHRFADTTSTWQAPIQVCGLYGELTWLTRMTCADGSRPWGDDIDKAHGARKDSAMDIAPSCKKPIELYIAPCPEHPYDIYLDIYQCGPGEELWREVDFKPAKSSP